MTIMPIEFYRTAEPFGFLSNYAEAPIFVDEVAWPTTEHYYQAQKFADPAQRDAIRAAPTPDAAKRLARASPASLRADWDEVRDTVMLAALRAKFAQHADLRAQLLATGDRTWSNTRPGTRTGAMAATAQVETVWASSYARSAPSCGSKPGPRSTTSSWSGSSQPAGSIYGAARSWRLTRLRPPIPSRGTGSRGCSWAWQSATRWATRPKG